MTKAQLKRKHRRAGLKSWRTRRMKQVAAELEETLAPVLPVTADACGVYECAWCDRLHLSDNEPATYAQHWAFRKPDRVDIVTSDIWADLMAHALPA